MYLILLISLILSFPILADNTLGLPPLNIPKNNPQTAEKIALGRAFFLDSRFSADGSISCASCHHFNKAMTDGLVTAKGINQKKGLRNAPTLVNAAFFETLFVDGRATSLEDQALDPFLNPIEHGLKNNQQILNVVLKDKNYSKTLEKIFDIPQKKITVQHIAKVIASYERTLIAGNSAFDQYFFGRDRTQLSASSARGLRVFRRKGNCANCHEISWNNAFFSDNRFYNIGIGYSKIQSLIDGIVQLIGKGEKPNLFPLTETQRFELGRYNVTKVLADIGKFKTPTLRNIALTAPYMHDGSIKTLAEVVEYYDKGGNRNQFIDAAMYPLHLTKKEKSDLVAFMQSLSSATLINY